MCGEWRPQLVRILESDELISLRLATARISEIVIYWQDLGKFLAKSHQVIATKF